MTGVTRIAISFSSSEWQSHLLNIYDHKILYPEKKNLAILSGVGTKTPKSDSHYKFQGLSQEKAKDIFSRKHQTSPEGADQGLLLVQS